MDGELSLLWRVRKTVNSMLLSRGYLLGREDVEMDLDEFRRRFGDGSGGGGGAAANAREALTVLASLRAEPTQQLFVFWAEEEKIGVKPIKQSAQPHPCIARLMPCHALMQALSVVMMCCALLCYATRVAMYSGWRRRASTAPSSSSRRASPRSRAESVAHPTTTHRTTAHSGAAPMTSHTHTPLSVWVCVCARLSVCVGCCADPAGDEPPRRSVCSAPCD